MAKRGRPPALDEDKRRLVLAILAVGCSRRTAAKYVGCAHTTIQRTALRDPEFAKQLECAEGMAELGYLKNIQAAARKEQYWRAAAWVLERRHPQEWGPRSPNVLTPEEVHQLLAALARIVIEEVPVAAYRKNVLKRLGRMVIGVDRAGTPEKEQPERETDAASDEP